MLSLGSSNGVERRDKMKKILAGCGLLVMLSTAAFAGGSYGFSFSYGSPAYGCGPRYNGGFTYGYNYCAPPVVYYAPPVQYYAPSVIYYRYQYAPPTYYYTSGGGYYYCH
jgi:hypothetical protein